MSLQRNPHLDRYASGLARNAPVHVLAKLSHLRQQLASAKPKPTAPINSTLYTTPQSH